MYNQNIYYTFNKTAKFKFEHTLVNMILFILRQPYYFLLLSISNAFHSVGYFIRLSTLNKCFIFNVDCITYIRAFIESVSYYCIQLTTLITGCIVNVSVWLIGEYLQFSIIFKRIKFANQFIFSDMSQWAFEKSTSYWEYLQLYECLHQSGNEM